MTNEKALEKDDQNEKYDDERILEFELPKDWQRTINLNAALMALAIEHVGSAKNKRCFQRLPTHLLLSRMIL